MERKRVEKRTSAWIRRLLWVGVGIGLFGCSRKEVQEEPFVPDSNLVKIADRGWRPCEYPRFSPDGKKIYYIASGELWVFDIATSEETMIYSGGFLYLDVSPDGSRLISCVEDSNFPYQYGRIVEIDPQSGSVDTVCDSPAAYPVYASDSVIYFQGRVWFGPGYHWAVMRIDGSDTSEVWYLGTELEGYRDLGIDITPDESFLLVGNLIVNLPDLTTDTLLGQISYMEGWTPSFDPTSRFVAYSREWEGENPPSEVLWIYDRQEQTYHQLDTRIAWHSAARQPSWSPGGDTLVFSASEICPDPPMLPNGEIWIYKNIKEQIGE